MVCGEEFVSVTFNKFSANFFNATGSQEAFHRDAAQKQNKFGVNQAKLLEEVQICTGFNFSNFGSAVGWGPTFNNIGYEEIGTRNAGASQNMVEVFSGATDEWTAEGVFLFARALADNHYFGIE